LRTVREKRAKWTESVAQVVRVSLFLSLLCKHEALTSNTSTTLKKKKKKKGREGRLLYKSRMSNVNNKYRQYWNGKHFAISW
jgi:hypothetical protein